jgi:transposase
MSGRSVEPVTDPATLCSRCGADRADDPPVQALAWVLEHTDRGPVWLCPSCARTHVRDIEGKLPGEYW